ncbi:MAG TPA: hypothetical protein DIS59_01750, partial [Candidatus Magasanikbacteria bacterium]|nr:hypothetical protein [Candidatus Magasanikbacteria bacterium]
MFLEILKMAGEALWSNKIRSFLSVLGIIIGVSTVIVVVGIGTGAKKQIEEQYKNLSATTIMVMKQMGRDAVSSSKLEAEDATVISQNIEHIKSTTVFISGNSTVAYGQESGSVNTFGIYDTFFDIGNLELEAGRLLTQEDVSNKSKVIVIGSGALTTLFGEEAETTQAVGQFITVSNKKMEIVGILKENGG